MRALSKQRLSKMHAMLDKELQNEQQTLSNHSSLSQNRKERGNFSHLRYTSNLNFDDEFVQSSKPLTKEKPLEISSQKPSLFKKSLEKNEKAKLQLNKQSRKEYGQESSSFSSSLQRHSKSNSMRGSRKNEINELEKKLLDLEKKMENINLSSSSDQEDEEVTKVTKSQQKHAPKTLTSSLNKNNSKNSLNVLNLEQNHIQHFLQNQVPQPNNPNQNTARFSSSNRNDENNKKQKNDFRSNLPLSHRKNTVSDEESSGSADDQYEMKYNKFVKVTRQAQNPVHQSKLNQKSNSSQEEDSSNQNHKSSALNKSISQQIQRLSITNKESKIVTNLKPSLSKSKLPENPPQKHHSRQQNAKINTIPVQPERKMTVQHEILQPKYQLQINKNKSQSRSKKSLKMPKNTLSKEKVLSVKNSNRIVKQQSTQKKRIERNLTNLDNSFRSDNSAKSKKSVNSLRSVGSNKSLGGKSGAGVGKTQNLEEKKYLKKIQNLEKELEHYKRLSKRYETQLSDYKLIQIQFKKMESQFRKSEQIRIEQKKIIENFRNKAINNA